MAKAVEIRDLSYSYPDGTPALCSVCIDIFEGETVGITGKNGAGKSTLLLHLNGILRGKGIIKIFGMEMNNENLMKIRSEVGIVFQDPDVQLFMPSVSEDVAFGPVNTGFPKDRVKEAVGMALKKVDLSYAADRPPHHLSLGEKKRASVASVLSMAPRILVLDEPCSNLDPAQRRRIINLIKELECTKIIASHDMDMIRETCRRTVVIDRGRITAS